MSSGDVLDRATCVLRLRSGGGASPESARTRARILASASRRTRSGRFAWTIAPLAAVFAVSTAWAGSQPRVRTALAHWDDLLFLARPPPTEPPKPVRRAAPAPVPPAEPMRVIDPPGDAVPLVSVEALPVAAAPVVSDRPPVPREPVGPSATPPTDTQALRLYAAAHRLHFIDRDSEGALRAWDAYLDAAPSGALAPEARYNRAICLLRLGRYAEARLALQPFADGAYGEYRAREARDLLAAGAR